MSDFLFSLLFFIVVFVKEINTASPTVAIVHLKVAAAPRLQPSDQSQQQPSEPFSLSNSIFFSTETTECIKKYTHSVPGVSSFSTLTCTRSLYPTVLRRRCVYCLCMLLVCMWSFSPYVHIYFWAILLQRYAEGSMLTSYPEYVVSFFHTFFLETQSVKTPERNVSLSEITITKKKTD